MQVDTQEKDGVRIGEVQYAHCINHLAAERETCSSARKGVIHFMF